VTAGALPPAAACVHGHFYQPPRENPWTGEVHRERSAAPFHDWNERITAECYRPNTAARVLDGAGLIEQVVSTYERISFNVGPTLHAWLARHAPDVDGALRDADRAGAHRYGRGGALAQPWAHVIMPLASDRDRRTLVRWGIDDFRHRFGRDPEGMWLPETAVDRATLQVLADSGIAFTILAPHQAAAACVGGAGTSGDAPLAPVDESTFDASVTYRADLDHGRSIAVCFYDGPLSRGVAFERVLDDGSALARRVADAVLEARPGGLVTIATDGESYGHHHRFGEMALARAILDLDASGAARLTNLASHVAGHPPERAVRVAEATSWSCAHGVERWRADCGCHLGGEGWNQRWRATLRRATDWLRGVLDRDFEQHGDRLFHDPWAARNAYGAYLPSGAPDLLDGMLDVHLRPAARDRADRVAARTLLESQRHRLTAETSCGWFFDDAAGLETVLVLRHAARACELTAAVTGTSHEPQLRARLRAMRSNVAAEGDGRTIWDVHVRRAAVRDAEVACALAARRLLDGARPSGLLGRTVVHDELGSSGRPGTDLAGELELASTATGATSRWRVQASGDATAVLRATAAPVPTGRPVIERALAGLPGDEAEHWLAAAAAQLRAGLARLAAGGQAVALATHEQRRHRPVGGWLLAAATEELAWRAREALAAEPVDGAALLATLGSATLLGIDPAALDVAADADAALARAAARVASGGQHAIDAVATLVRSHLAPRDGTGWWHAQTALVRALASGDAVGRRAREVAVALGVAVPGASPPPRGP
jgi:hypothetical protein